MKQGGINKTIRLALVGTLLTGVSLTSTSAELKKELPTVKVSAFGRHVGNRIKYHYRVINNTKHTIVAISIGRDSREDNDPVNDILELNSRPSGWDPKYGLPSSSYNSPNGWRASMTTYDEEEENEQIGSEPSDSEKLESEQLDVDQTVTEQLESDQAVTEALMPYAITWEPLNERSPKLLGGQYSTKFSVTVDEADVNFLSGHALIVFETEENQQRTEEEDAALKEEVDDKDVTEAIAMTLSVPIELIDTTPPSLEVSLTPNEILLTDGDVPVAIKSSIKTKDDLDSMPRIRLEAISTDGLTEGDNILDASFGLDDRYFKLQTNPLTETDRTYVIYYSATDAAWNQTLTSSTVTVFGAHTDDAMDIQEEFPDGESHEGMPTEDSSIVPAPLESAPSGLFR